MLVDTGSCDAFGTACSHRRPRNSCVDCKVRPISVCSVLALDELAVLETLGQHLSLDKRQVLYGQEEPAEAVFNVIDGSLRLTRLLSDGRRQVMGFALPGDFLGLAREDRFSVSAEALTPVTVCRFERRAFGALVDDKPHLLRSLHERAGHELTLAQDQMLLLGRRTAEERVASFLVGLRERYARMGRASVTLELPMGRQDMADYLGLTIETVSRMLTRLDRERTVLIVPGGVRLLDPARLEALAAS
ncbi:helix-turn-helix domain-containing protein [Methylobacterium nodulans]|uniref:Transcriptional regulator, Crp/Fnr family n=1 Tax=Methylobacterium nodulans (strain LMG 21967 / CNCM I-2342 / ORS 2060) TaxID=460265 RepID=B8IC76_METNO|nr:helix-turn-helix domain-containing protein [Methylobacterium nodulans]ACL55464.1 transcriptional regulator, Crp/Fnr family [Methylobacterium nodulans ORS 2060]